MSRRPKAGKEGAPVRDPLLKAAPSKEALPSATAPREAMIEMKVSRLVSDPFSNLPVLVLDDGVGLEIAIGIGMNEAPAIASELNNIEMQRPIAHDLIKTIVGQCGARVEAVELRDVRKETFYATLVLRIGGARVEVDARPSDAIAVALRTRARIHVAQKVLDKTRRGGAPRSNGAQQQLDFLSEPEDAGPIRALDAAWLLEALRDEDFGKWKM